MESDVITQLARAKLTLAFDRLLTMNGLNRAAAEDLARHAIESKRFAIDPENGALKGDDPGMYFDDMRSKEKHSHLFAAIDPEKDKKERGEFFGYTRAEFSKLRAIEKLQLANSKWEKEEQARQKARQLKWS